MTNDYRRKYYKDLVSWLYFNCKTHGFRWDPMYGAWEPTSVPGVFDFVLL